MNHEAHTSPRYLASFCATLAVAGATLLAPAALAAPTEPTTLVAGPQADASTRGVSRETDAADSTSVSFDGWLGVGARLEEGSDGWEGMPSLGLKGLYRADVLAVGAVAELSGGLFEDNVQYFGALGGVTVAPTTWFDVTTLAEAGLHLEQPSESTFMVDSYEITGGDTNSVVPYAGLRIDPMFRIGTPGRNRFIIGPTLAARQDLNTTTQEYTAETCDKGLFTGEYSCSTDTETNPVGGLQLAAGLSAGIEL